MKKIKCILLTLLIASLANAQETGKNFKLTVSSDGKLMIQSVQLFDGNEYENGTSGATKEYVFNSTVARYGIHLLTVNYVNKISKKASGISIQLFLKPGDTKLVLQGSDGKYSITGASAVAQKSYEALVARDQACLKRIQLFESRMRKYQESDDKIALAQMKDSMTSAEMARKVLYESYIRQHPNDDLSLYAMKMYSHVNRENPLDIKSLLATLGKELQATEEMIAIKKDAQENESFMKGVKAPAFTQADTSGTAISLASFQGKYVLVDFWASWCKPCRAQNPALLRIHQKYKDKGFTILGISLDAKKEAWLKAIHDDRLEWQQVSDLNSWKNAVAKQYKITSVPQNYLLDTQGVIIGKNLSEEDLEQLLEKELVKSN